jgi:hypothetical protein
VHTGMSVDALNHWDGSGEPPVDADGSPQRPQLVDTSALRPLLPRTVRNLLKVLASP